MVMRFIAGARCPACDEQDSIRAEIKSDLQYRECVSCGFSETVDPNQQPLQEPVSRVSPKVDDEGRQVVRILQAPSRSNR